MSLKEYESFAIPPVVAIEEGRGGLPFVKITGSDGDLRQTPRSFLNRHQYRQGTLFL